MSIGLVGRKCGMTRVFHDDGSSVPVTVLSIEPNRIVQIKTLKSDGYRAIQVTTGNKKASHVTKALAGHYAKVNVLAGEGLWEFKLSEDEGEELSEGSQISVDIFSAGQIVDVQGNSIGKGFAGGVKRHHFSMQDATHGNSLSHRVLGSIGMNQTPGRVFKGKKMAGHLGAKKVTVQNLTILSIDTTKNLVLVKGSVPGSDDGHVIITPASKAKR